MNGKRIHWMRHFPHHDYGYGYPYYDRPMLTERVVGRRTTSKSMDICIVVPRRRPAIEQVIRAYIHRLRVTCVDVVMNEVIVRGHFDVKLLYVGCVPSQSVHAVESRRVRFTAGVYMPGACYGMTATAKVYADYVDADCDDWREDDYEEYDCCRECRYLAYDYYGWPRHHDCCTRRCHVTVSLDITASVFGTGPLPLPPPMPLPLPKHPKG